MRKVLSIFALIAVGLVLFVPHCSLAQTGEWGITSPIGGTLQTAVGSVVNLLFAVVAIVALFYLIIGSYQYLMSGGNPEAQEAAKKTMGNALVGMITVVLSYLIITFILTQLEIIDRDVVIW